MNTALADLTFHSAANFNGNFSISTFISDGQTQPLLGSKSFSGVAVNDAPTFAKGDGIVTTTVGSGGDGGQSITVQVDGKILVAGYSSNGSNYDFALTRYNTDGTLDTSFSSDGKVITALGSDSDYGQSVIVQTDGKILVAGYSSNSSNIDFALTRYNTDGTLDTSFNSDGKVITALGSGSDYGRSVTVQVDGKILVAGGSWNGSNNEFALIRYNGDGSLDTSFDSDGIVTTSIGNHANGRSVSLQTDGKILVVGEASNEGSASNAALVRYNSDGSLDSTFGTDGKVITPMGANGGGGAGKDVTMQTDGKILVLGYSFNDSNWEFVLIRYNSDGSLDTSFDSDGKVTIDLKANAATDCSVSVQVDGKILVAGNSWNGSNNDFALIRYNSDGSLDTSFNSDGKVTTAVSSGNGYGQSVSVQVDGKILVAGIGFNGGNSDFAVVRYNSDGSLDTTFDAQNTLSGTANYTENGAAVVLDSNVNISDIELDAVNSYNGVSITLARHSGANRQDVFSGSGSLTLSNNTAVLNGITVGSYTQNNGELVITFNNNATSTAVDSALQQIAYSNTSDNPPASVQINWTFNDGNTGTQGSGGALNAIGSTTVDIIATNDTPTFIVGDGIVTTDFPESSNSSGDVGEAIVVQTDGKIVVAGWNPSGFAVVRYNSDGSLDTSFDSDGKLTTYISGHDLGHNVFVQDDGKITVTGWSRSGFSLVHYNSDGSLDGKFTFEIPATSPHIAHAGSVYTDSIIQADGKILIVGSDYNHIIVVRYNPDGSFDTSFGVDGVLTTTIGDYSQPRNVVLQADGKILVGGDSMSINGSLVRHEILVRYNIDGSLDASFDGDGIAIVQQGQGQGGYVSLQADGKILLTGSHYNEVQSGFSIVRFNTDGSLDTSFGHNGIAVTPEIRLHPYDHDVILQNDGKIVVAGRDDMQPSFIVARYNSDGSIDTSFNDDGIVTTSIGSSAWTHDVTLQADGKILLVGRASNGNNYDFAVVRYNTDGSLDTAFGEQQNTLGGTVNYTENSTAVVLDSNVNISDIELDAANNYNGASVTLARHGGADSQDVFTGSGTLTLSNNAVVLNSTTVGSYTQNNGELVITFNNNATSAAVDSALQQIAYSNTSDNPPASAQIDWTFNDGNTGAQGTGGALNAIGSTTINITAVNDAPTGTATAGLANSTEDTIYNITQESLLAGFSDVDGDSLSVANLTATNGTLTAVASGWTFTPNANYNGAVNLNYNVIDGNGGSVAAVQSFEVAAVNDAPTFAKGDGIVITEVGTFDDIGTDVVIQNDGKIVVSGSTLTLISGSRESGNWSTSSNAMLVRYNVDGSLDTSFDSDGKLISTMGSGLGSFNAIQPDGKILVTGSGALSRYYDNGTLDLTFGDNGSVSINNIHAFATSVQSDGKILVAGEIFVNGEGAFALARYDADGSLDTSFGNDGQVITTGTSSWHFAGFKHGDMTLQSDGKILVTGAYYAENKMDFLLVRYDTNGGLDSSFGTDGKVFTSFGTSSSYAYDVTVQNDGKILVTGGYDNRFTLVRYDDNGVLDSSFGVDGKVTTSITSSDVGQSVKVQDDGKILVAGYSYNAHFTLARYDSNGTLDSSFGGDGIITTDIIDTGLTHLNVTATTQADGKILLVGSALNTSNDYDIALVRYNPDGSLDTTFGEQQNTLGGTANYTENGATVVLDSNVNISDLELDAANNYNGASITLVRHEGANSEDVFSGSGSLTLSNNTAVLNGTTVGSYTQNNGELVITFNNNATSAAVDSVLQQISYSNTSDNPPASVQLDWTFNDGNTGAQGSGGALNAIGSTTVNITAVNDAPTNLAISASSINENVTASSVIGILSSTDPDVGNTFTYSLVTGTGSTDNNAFSIVGNQLKINSSPDFETKASYSVLVRTTDQGGLFFDKALTIAVNNINDAPTGVVTISDTSPEQNQVLSASDTLFDTDGLGSITYTWKTDTTVLGTGSNYTVTANEVGKTISVTASYTDGLGNLESVASANTSVVTAPVTPISTFNVTTHPTYPNRRELNGLRWLSL